MKKNTISKYIRLTLNKPLQSCTFFKTKSNFLISLFYNLSIYQFTFFFCLGTCLDLADSSNQSHVNEVDSPSARSYSKTKGTLDHIALRLFVSRDKKKQVGPLGGPANIWDLFQDFAVSLTHLLAWSPPRRLTRTSLIQLVIKDHLLRMPLKFEEISKSYLK